jgi:hypothetical protein
MTKFTGGAKTIASSPWFIIIGSISSMGGFFWYLYDRISQSTSLLSGIYFGISLIVLLIGIFYSIKIRSENIALRQIAGSFNEINGIYRDSLKDMFGGNNPVEKPEDLLEEEKTVLRSVCQRIENIYMQLIDKECTVTLKLLVKDEEGRYFAHTYVRSIEKSSRDKPERRRYRVGTGANTAFDEAMFKKQIDGSPSHFYSPDLTKGHYCNERQRFKKFYRSTIVVPIRGSNKGKEGTNEEFDMIGFLCVDTNSTNRLKKGYQLQIMSSLAGQMYNFMSLMRGKYTVFGGSA